MGAAILLPVDVGFFAEDAGPFLSYVRDGSEGTNIQSDSIIQFRISADRLLLKGFPAACDQV